MYEELHKALCAIRDRCDGVKAKDGQGFNRPDSAFGHQMAERPPRTWSFRQAAKIHTLLRKYTRQLNEEGIVYAKIPVPAERQNMIEDQGNAILVTFARKPESEVLEWIRARRAFFRDGHWVCPAMQREAIHEKFPDFYRFSTGDTHATTIQG